jgi:hypothetical protein
VSYPRKPQGFPLVSQLAVSVGATALTAAGEVRLSMAAISLLFSPASRVVVILAVAMAEVNQAHCSRCPRGVRISNSVELKRWRFDCEWGLKSTEDVTRTEKKSFENPILLNVYYGSRQRGSFSTGV